jgi:hypothetical protein
MDIHGEDRCVKARQQPKNGSGPRFIDYLTLFPRKMGYFTRWKYDEDTPFFDMLFGPDKATTRL